MWMAKVLTFVVVIDNRPESSVEGRLKFGMICIISLL